MFDHVKAWQPEARGNVAWHWSARLRSPGFRQSKLCGIPQTASRREALAAGAIVGLPMGLLFLAWGFQGAERGPQRRDPVD